MRIGLAKVHAHARAPEWERFPTIQRGGELLPRRRPPGDGPLIRVDAQGLIGGEEDWPARRSMIAGIRRTGGGRRPIAGGEFRLDLAAEDVNFLDAVAQDQDAELRPRSSSVIAGVQTANPCELFVSARAVNLPADSRVESSERTSKTPGPNRVTMAPWAKAIWALPAARSILRPGRNSLPQGIAAAASVQRQFLVATSFAAGW